MSISRRAFLKSSAALPVLRWGSMTERTSPQGEPSFDPWVEVNTVHLRHNIAPITNRVDGRPILAVLKNNGYGLGLINVARALEPMGEVAGFAVVKLQEAVTLRDGGIRKPVLLMGSVGEQEVEETVAKDITLMVYTPMGSVLDKISRALNRVIGVHVCIDTGIGRIGVPYTEAIPLVLDLANRISVRIEGIMMTFTEEPEFDKEQLRRFQWLCAELERQGIHLGRKHAVSSFGLFQHPEAFLDMVRPGMAIFGIYPEQDFHRSSSLELRPALSLKARVVYVKQLHKGDSAGYNRVYRAERDVWVATLPVGHADGLPRVATKGARVRINNDLYPVIAVSASHAIVEVGPEKKVSMSDTATVFDWQDGSRPEDFSASCGSSVYDLTMHLNALLPRRMIS